MLPNADLLVPDAACCSSLFDIADHLLSNVFTALQSCYSVSPCPVDSLYAYVTMGRGDDGVLDSLSVNFTSATPSVGTNGSGRTLSLGLYRAVFTVRLVESGWPTVEVVNGEVFAPNPVKQNALARHAFAHGEAMYRKLIQMVNQRNITPATVLGCSNATIGPLTPLTPLGGSVGFTTQIMIDVPWGGG